MASRILRMNGDLNPVGVDWLRAFLRRNPRVSSIVGRPIEAARSTAASAEQVYAFLQLFESTRTRLGVRAGDTYNMDETGTALGVCTNTRVLAKAGTKKTYTKSPENREWATVIETISADGRKLRCLVIFKGKSLQTTWFLSETVPDWYYTTSKKGWTSNAIGLEWLERVFIPEARAGHDRPVLLLLDGHGSHIDIEFLWRCKEHRIHLLFLPAHSSHVLQPLDLAPFTVVKSSYREQIRELS